MRDSYRSSQDWLYPQRFDYEPLNEMWAAVWLELPLGAGESAPSGPELAVRCGTVETSHPAFLSCTARVRADGTRPVPGAVPDACAGHLLWRARFSVPRELVDGEAEFTLRAAGGVAIALPAPSPPAALAGLQAASAPAVLRVRRQAVAFAAGFVAASMPVTAAAADTAPAGPPPGTSGTTTTTPTPPTPPTPPTDPTGTGDGSGTTSGTTGTGTTTTGTTTDTTTTGTTTTTSTTASPPSTSTPPPASSTPTPPPSTTTTTTAAAPAVAPITSSAGGSPTVHWSGGESIPTPAPKAPSKSSSHHTGKHPTSLRCTEAVPAKTKAKLSKSALARLERTASKTKAKCMSVARKKHQTATHGDHRVVHRDVRGAISGGAGVKPVLVPSGDGTLLTGGSTLFQPNPAAASAWSRLSLLFAHGDRPPPFLVPIYKAAARKYHVPWPVLAAINAVETDYGRDVKTSSAGAMGWMQFMPDTWLKYGVAVGKRAAPNPYDPRDAIYAAARYLAANGARHSLRRAIFAYNHAHWYVDEILWTAANIIDHSRVRGSRARVRIAAMQAMASALEGEPYLWGGGHGGWEISAGYDCSGFVSAVLHSAGYLKAPVTTQSLPSQRNIVEGPGRYVTIFDRTDGAGLGDDHVIVDLHGQWWESGGESGAGVHRMKHVSASYLLSFNQILHPRGL